VHASHVPSPLPQAVQFLMKLQGALPAAFRQVTPSSLRHRTVQSLLLEQLWPAWIPPAQAAVSPGLVPLMQYEVPQSVGPKPAPVHAPLLP